MKASEWTFDRIKEAFKLVAQDETEKMSIVQEIMLRSTDYLRRIIAPVGGQGGVTMSYLCPNSNSFPLEDYVWWVSGGKTMVRNVWRKVRLEATKQAVGRANLVNALMLLANQQEDGDGLPQNIAVNLGEGSRKGLTDGLQVRVDNERALDVGALR